MRNLFIILILSLTFIDGTASVRFTFDRRSDVPDRVKSKIERNVSSLLTEITDAVNENRELNFDGIDIEDGAKQHLMSQMEFLPYVCASDNNVASCIYDHQGYQIRGLEIIMRPLDDSYNQALNRQLTISLNRKGVITGVRPALESQESAAKIMGQGRDVEDTALRHEILKWVEDFRNYYNERDLVSLKKIYSDDALIITGSVVTRRQVTDLGQQIVKSARYSVQSKQEYINKLARIFKSNRYIDVKFDHISVARHSSRPEIYGVTLHQSWRTSRYSDEGWLFLLWDFSVPDSPQIHVRAWQPDQMIEEGEEIFSLHDVYIPRKK